MVDDATGEPLPGATVVVEGTGTGTTTNSDGAFTLDVTDLNASLAVSYIGFVSEMVPLNGQEDVIVRLREDVANLEEVVVVGYGTQRLADVTGSVTSVSPTRLEDVPNTSFVQALQGALPGVRISQAGGGAEGSMNLLIRGQNSIAANNEPLVVLDGIPYNGSLSEINQYDIASIEILKDASAAAIYGARGANGVILVTTKKGTVGRPRVTFDSYVGTQQIANLPRLMTGPEFAAFKCTRANDGMPCTEDQIAGSLTASERANYEAGEWVDWVDLATRQGFQQQHNLSFSGGTVDTRYYITASALNVKGVARNDEFSRYALRVNLDQTMNAWLQMGTSTQLTYTDRSGLPASFSDAFQMNPLTNAYAEDGETLTLRPWPDDVFFSNPLQGLVTVDDDINRRVVSSNFVEVDLPFIDNLTYRLNAGIDYAHNDGGRYYGRNTAAAISEHGLGHARVENSSRFDWTLENIVRYQKAFGRHLVDVTGLVSAQRSYLAGEVIHAYGFPNDVRSYRQIEDASFVDPATANVRDERLLSQMARVNYSYDSRYLLTLTARRDGYSGFGINQKYGLFPSIALGWNVARESFWPVPRTVNSLKFRFSYGQNGNQAVPPYRTLARMQAEAYVDGTRTLPGFLPQTLGNPNLKWETTTSVNLGLDFGLLEDRITGTLDLYLNRTEDLLLNRTISPVHGITSITENIGKTRNRGIEFSFSSVNIETDAFTWTTEFNISANRNEIVSLYGLLDDEGQEVDDVANRWFISEPIDVNYAYDFGGVWQQADEDAFQTLVDDPKVWIKDDDYRRELEPGDLVPVDANGDSLISADDRVFIGSAEPAYVAGLSNTIRYKGWSLNFFLTTVQGVTRSNVLLGTNQVQSDTRLNTLYLEHWTPDNPINTRPRNSETSNPHSVGFYEDASFIRLKDVTLAYTLPERFVSRLGMETLRLYVNGRNLWTLTDWSGLDPELSSQRAIPLQKVFIGGVNVTF